VIILIGESGCGKSTVERIFKEEFNMTKIISYTTRPKRDQEEHGIDYYFLEKEKFEFLKNADFFAECIEYGDFEYAIAKKDCVQDSIVCVVPDGLQQIKDLRNIEYTSFYIKVSERERMNRMLKRGDEVDNIMERILQDRETFREIESIVDFVIEGERYNADEVVSIINLILGKEEQSIKE
jgi:guanylate kinase